MGRNDTFLIKYCFQCTAAQCPRWRIALADFVKNNQRLGRALGRGFCEASESLCETTVQIVFVGDTEDELDDVTQQSRSSERAGASDAASDAASLDDRKKHSQRRLRTAGNGSFRE